MKDFVQAADVRCMALGLLAGLLTGLTNLVEVIGRLFGSVTLGCGFNFNFVIHRKDRRWGKGPQNQPKGFRSHAKRIQPRGLAPRWA